LGTFVEGGGRLQAGVVFHLTDGWKKGWFSLRKSKFIDSNEGETWAHGGPPSLGAGNASSNRRPE